MSMHPADSRILVVEDSPANIQALTAILRNQGYLVSIASNGRQALKVLGSVRPDLILLDVMMPELDGYETCRLIKDHPDWRHIPLMFLTAKSDPEDIVRGFELGALDYVAKPFHAHELLARVQTHLAMDQLRRENERLIRSESENARHRSVAQMVAGVAHELNTPLGILNTAASLLTKWLSSPALMALQETPDGQRLAEDLADTCQLITRNVTRAHKLVQDFKKVSVNQITDIREKAVLAEVVAETVHLFQVSSRQSPIQVNVVNTMPDPQAEWMGYPGSLSQVLLNLLSNVQRYAYAASGGKVDIELTCDPEDGGFVVEVRDFGQGIPPEHLGRVFEPFFTTGRGKGGSGLGMSVVHTIVTAQLQGTIELTSTPGQGTMVRMKFPREVSS